MSNFNEEEFFAPIVKANALRAKLAEQERRERAFEEANGIEITHDWKEKP